MPEDEQTLKIITRFTEFLEEFGKGTPDQTKAFLEYIGPQSRSDLLALAEAIAKRNDSGR